MTDWLFVIAYAVLLFVVVIPGTIWVAMKIFGRR